MHRFSSLRKTFSGSSWQRRLGWALGVSLCTAVIVLLTVGASFTKQHLADWNVLPKPEQLTELYFTHPQALPNQYVPGQRQMVTITVHNNESGVRTYRYALQQTDNNGQHAIQLASGDITVAAGQRKDVAITIRIADRGSRSKVVVSLDRPAESVSYWLTRRSTK